jgi:hypothetical protein
VIGASATPTGHAACSDDLRVYVSDSNLAPQLAALGDIEGDHQGMCLVRLPGGGQHRVASGDLRLFSEGVVGRLPDGRRFFAHVSGLLVLDLNSEPGQPAEPGQ